jgi:hypothetical protein
MVLLSGASIAEIKCSAFISLSIQLRVYSFGLMAEPTRQQALLACERCLGLNIPVDVIATQAERVISTLDPYNDILRSSSSL